MTRETAGGTTMWVDVDATRSPRASRDVHATMAHVRRELERCRRLIDQALSGLADRVAADHEPSIASRTDVALGDDELFQVGPQGAD